MCGACLPQKMLEGVVFHFDLACTRPQMDEDGCALLCHDVGLGVNQSCLPHTLPNQCGIDSFGYVYVHEFVYYLQDWLW